MENVNLHKQRLGAIIIAVLILIFLFLPWQKDSAQGFESSTHMGFVIWGGIICALAVVGILATCLLVGDKIQPFTKQAKIIVIACFALILLLSLIVAIASNGTQQGQTNWGGIVEIKKSAGIGAWLGLIGGLIGLVWSSGIVDQLMQQKPVTIASSAPPPPPPPPPAS